MMIAAKARAVVNLAREIADNVPFPPGGRRPDPDAYRAWEEVMLNAASGLAVSTGYDCEVLEAAVGPAIEVGANPPWRVLLQIAQLEAAAHIARQDRQPELPREDRQNVVSLHRATQHRASQRRPAQERVEVGGWLGQPAGGLA
jgi:hypothetical protein